MTANWNPDVDSFRKNRGQEEVRKFDSYAHAVTMISEPHRMIHDGFMFNASGIEVGVANAASLDVLMVIPAGSAGHLTLVEYQLDDAPCTVEFRENVVVSAAGAAALVKNHNRFASDDSAVTITTGPTITDLGDLVHTRYIPAGAAPGGQPAGMLVPGEDNEWVMSPGTYLWRMTNNSGGAITIGYLFAGYEIGYER